MHCLELDTKCDDVEDRNIPKSEKTDCLEMNRKRYIFGDIRGAVQN